MARAAREDNSGETAVVETVTYTPGQHDPLTVVWCGHTFNANVPKEIKGNGEGTDRERLNMQLIERARDNPHFKVGSGPAKRQIKALPKDAADYRAYMVDWLADPSIQHADQLIARFAKDHDLQVTCEVGADDYAYLATLFMPRLHDLAKGDELTEGQVASLWINHGINQLPW